MRPTGRMHLGNYVGALENWVRLQDEFDSFFMVADWHALTTGPERAREIRQNVYDMVLDWLSAGLDPARSPIFVQSHVKEHAELHLIFSMLVTKARLERNPTLKEQVRDLGMEESLVGYGHLGYPVLQAADILLYKGDVVPVGEDQVPHVELTREIARRFNFLYASEDRPVFPEPEARLTTFARLRGLDGTRMSKSVGNTVWIGEEPAAIARLVHTAYTDPKKIRLADPGRPEADASDGHPGCVVYEYHRKFNPAEAAAIAARCRAGELGCVADKKHLSGALAAYLAPIRERRAELAREPDRVWDVIADGDRRARAVAAATMADVRAAMGLG
jgi:tryptophanyl-tRNA synthetase